MPPEVLDPPDIWVGYESWLSIFWELSTDRQMGFGSAGPIPFSTIEAYTKGWDPLEKAWFRRCIRAMDSAVMGVNNPAPTQPEVVKSDESVSDQPEDVGPINSARDQFRSRFGR